MVLYRKGFIMSKSFVTKLGSGWIAVHDDLKNLIPESTVILRRLDKDGMATGIDIEVPYGVVYTFIAEVVRESRLRIAKNRILNSTPGALLEPERFGYR